MTRNRKQQIKELRARAEHLRKQAVRADRLKLPATHIAKLLSEAAELEGRADEHEREMKRGKP
jgi:hypothetical protein